MTARTPVAQRTHTVVDSPVGPLTLVAVGGALAGLYMDRQRHAPPDWVLGEPDTAALEEARNEAVLTRAADQLAAYFAGRLTAFDLPLHLDGSAFQRRVWTALQAIPYGETRSYGQLADEIGQPTAARAVGLANGRNPVGIIVPCHRVVGASGSLTGYGGGLDRKRHLLDLERRVRTARPA